MNLVGHVPARRRHVRVQLATSPLAPRLFADFYRGRPLIAPVRPLVCFWDGAISAEEYERRRTAAPSLIVRAWRQAAFGRAVAPDLLVFSLPEVEPCTTYLLRRRLRRTFAQVLAAGPNPLAPAVGFVGYSAGAYLATCLALDLRRARALATLGGVGMAGALADAPRARLRRRLSAASFVNARDPCRDQTLAFVRAAAARGAPIALHDAAGGHELADYAANGSLHAALAFAVDRLQTRARAAAPRHG